MKKLLLAIPTEIEVHRAYYDEIKNQHDVDLLLTGVGIHRTTYNLTRYLSTNCVDLLLHAGICGSFTQRYPIGSVVEITADTFADFGIDEETNFIHGSRIFNEPLWYENEGNILSNLPRVKGVTVNSISANRTKIDHLMSQFNPEVETMENAAALFVCQQMSVTVFAIRAVSNYVAERNKDSWNIPLAIENLWLTLKKIVKEIDA